MNLKPFGYNRIQLAIPQEWDLTRAIGDSRRGEMVFDDGEEPRLSVQWSPCDPNTELETLRRKAIGDDRNLTVVREEGLSDCHWFANGRTDLGKIGVSVILDRHEGRAVCMRQFRPKGQPAATAQAFARPLLEGPKDNAYRWTFFATDFRLDRSFELTDARMDAGVNRLTFRRGRRDLTVWDFSLLDHIETRMATHAFAVQLIQKEFRNQFGFDEGAIHTFADRGDFMMPGYMLLRWLMHPARYLLGNRRARLEGCANRETNRFGLLFWRFRKEEDRDAVCALADSLRGATAERMSA